MGGGGGGGWYFIHPSTIYLSCKGREGPQWLMGVTVHGCIGNRQMEERKHILKDKYVQELQPFNLYPISHNTEDSVSKWGPPLVSLETLWKP